MVLVGQVNMIPSAHPSPVPHTPVDTPLLPVLLVLVGRIIQRPAGQDGILSEYGRSQCWIGYQLDIGGGYHCSKVRRGKGLLSTVSGTWVAGDGV